MYTLPASLNPVLCTIAAMGIWAAELGASPLPLYTPGGAPCAGVCSYEWARERANAPEGEARPMVVPAGAIVQGMSYGSNGEARWSERMAILATDEPAIGYEFERDGRRLVMVRLAQCQNWAIMALPRENVAYDQPSAQGPALTRVGNAPSRPLPVAFLPSFAATGGSGGGGGSPNVITGDTPDEESGWLFSPEPRPRPEESPEAGPETNTPAPVPLPAALWITLGALAALFGFRARRGLIPEK